MGNVKNFLNLRHSSFNSFLDLFFYKVYKLQLVQIENVLTTHHKSIVNAYHKQLDDVG